MSSDQSTPAGAPPGGGRAARDGGRAAPSATRATALRDPRLMRAQRRHAWAILALPLAGSALAIGLAIGDGGVPWQALAILGVCYLLTYAGITVGFHRLLSHRAFETATWLRNLLAVLGCMAAQGPAIYWAANHRLHHIRSDRDGDPHSPRIAHGRALGRWEGFWHAQIGWTFNHTPADVFANARDLTRDRSLMKINQRYLWWVALGLAVPALAGLLMLGDAYGALLGLLWGGAVRLTLSYHFTNAINSVTHIVGTRPFGGRNTSTNFWPIALPTLGEAWHNNHHAFPTSARFGLDWREPDIGWWIIRGLEAAGLARNIRRPAPESIAARRAAAADQRAMPGPSVDLGRPDAKDGDARDGDEDLAA
ncbi:fatty acid desaturase [Tistrella bauzanensis]|uniref:Fatty acid desaturase n=1 Tax=Tistrella bauzanensis TaxID=657419 RepID=A0ABQ1ISG0_9PROT|nr:fatty acid desaturase [Tistrella bauzanensis]GGB50068.1 fatty acid desaturase [Tistrella bauzanensis]